MEESKGPLSLHLQKIPVAFFKYLNGCNQERAVLRRAGKEWQVKVNGRLLEEGWGKFAEEHDLDLGDCLVFRHEGDMEFEVSIFNANRFKREYEQHLGGVYEGEEESDHSCKKFKSQAAFIAEPVMGAGGVIPPPVTYFEKIQAVVKKYDILFIVDEVICAFGRLGTMFGCDKYNIKPDLFSLAKALSSAYMPIGAILTTILLGFFSPVNYLHSGQLDEKDVAAVSAVCAFLHVTFNILPLERIMTVLAYPTELVAVLGSS